MKKSQMRTLILAYLLLISAFLTNITNASSFRGHPQNDQLQVEDYKVMQLEVQWAMKTMTNYRGQHGKWPTRPPSNESNYSSQDESSGSKLESISVVKISEKDLFEHRAQKIAHEEEDKKLANPMELKDELAPLLRSRKTAKTVDEYWDSLISIF